MINRILCGTLAATLLLCTAPTPARAADADAQDSGKPVAPDVAVKWDAFCIEWMGKLAARERDNLANIKWEKQADGVVGAYTGYSQDHICTLKAGTGEVPIGKIVYVETRYEKSGPNPTEAKASTANAIEQVEVTEIFRYTKGKWEF